MWHTTRTSQADPVTASNCVPIPPTLMHRFFAQSSQQVSEDTQQIPFLLLQNSNDWACLNPGGQADCVSICEKFDFKTIFVKPHKR